MQLDLKDVSKITPQRINKESKIPEELMKLKNRIIRFLQSRQTINSV